MSSADPGQVTDGAWRKLLRDSARTAGYRGEMILGEDLMRIQVTPQRYVVS